MLLKIRGVEVEFPYTAYECQTSFMRKLLEALQNEQSAVLESPTGTGKTLCLLCGALAFVKDVKSRLKTNVENAVQGVSAGSLFPKILYASRTHSQLAQVVRELNKTLYKDTKTVVLGSRDVLCINEKIMREENSVTKAFMCRNLVNSRRCPYYNEFEKLDNTTLEFLYSEKGCVPDIEDVISISKKNRICPFYKVRSAYETAELILLPYNYVIDPGLRRIHDIKLKGNIVIFDEAHNLESICEESFSSSLSTLDLSGSIRECKTVLEGLINDEEEIRAQKDACEEGFTEEKPQEKALVEKNDVAHLLLMLQSLENGLDQFYKTDETGRNLHSSDGKVYAGQKMVDLLVKAEIRCDIRDEISFLVDRIGQYLAHKASSDDGSGIWSVKGVYLRRFASFVSTVHSDGFGERISQTKRLSRNVKTNINVDCGDSFQLLVRKENNSLVFNYWCFTPSLAMRSLYMRGVRSVILTSGTLSPMDAFINGMEIDIPVRLQNGHVANSSQLITACVRADSYNNVLCGSFKNRDTESYLLGVGNMVIRACSFVPQGVLVFFASYSLMHLCLNRWKKFGGNDFSLWNEICKYKKPFFEPKSKTELKLVLLQYKEAVTEADGAVLFAVCRGKVSEGIDFADCESRAVVVVGVPYAPTTDPRVELKRRYLAIKSREKEVSLKSMNAEEWYQTDAIRAVNQAIGRVLRHKDDFGVVILADSRFCTLNRKVLPSWVQSTVRIYSRINDFEPEAVELFERHGMKIRKLTEQKKSTKNDSINIAKKRRKITDEGCENVSNREDRLLTEIKVLYTADEILNFKKSQSETDGRTIGKPTKDALGSKLDEIDVLNGTGGFDEFEAIKKKYDEDLEIFKEVRPSIIKRRGIKLKPNSHSNEAVVQKIQHHLEDIRKTPDQFVEMLRRESEVCRRKVKIALKDYSANQNVKELIDKVASVTLPNSSDIFFAVYGFINDRHKNDFAAACHSHKLFNSQIATKR